MRIISLNTGLPKEVLWNGRPVLTGIFKSPVSEKQNVTFAGIKSDGQADLIHHGGEHKAVYAYSYENYQYWKDILPEQELDYGIFGENLTISGHFSEINVSIGDCFSIGTAELMAVQPRIPCYKLAIRFDNNEMPKLFTQSKLCGVYFKVIKEGQIQKDDKVELIRKAPENVSIHDVFNLIMFDTKNSELMSKYVKLENLSPNVKDLFRQRLEKLVN